MPDFGQPKICEECPSVAKIELADGGYACENPDHYFVCPSCNEPLMVINRERNGLCYSCNGGE